MKIYVGFSKPIKYKIGAKAISWWIGAPYSHTYVRFESSDPEIPSNVYHAAHGMVHFMTQERFHSINQTVVEYQIEVTKEERKAQLIKAMKLQSVEYSTLELVNIFLYDLCNKLGCDKVKFHDPKGYICSELVADIIEIKFQIKWIKERYLLSPKDIELKLKDLKLESVLGL